MLSVEEVGRGLWVYADGRMVWFREPYAPGGSGEPATDTLSTGILEQRLSPGGIERLRSAIVSTGLFDQDLAIVTDPAHHPLVIEIRNGDHLVRTTWAPRGWYDAPGDAPLATPEQSGALEELRVLLHQPASWPASSWADLEVREFVPSTYVVWVRGIPDAVELPRALALLPDPARELLRDADSLDTFPAMSTDRARVLAAMLDTAGIDRAEPAPGPGEYWLHYRIDDPERAANSIVINFGPVLPHGEVVWLGPG
jgi:hypothetical protein